MTSPSKPTPTTERSPDNPAVHPVGTAGAVATPSTEPASTTTPHVEINIALREFVRALARATATRDWNRAVTDLTNETDQPIKKDGDEQ